MKTSAVPPKISARKNFLMKTGLMFVSLVVSLLILEIGIRWLSPPSPLTPFLPLRPYMKRELHPDLRGVSPVAHYSTNRWGMRGDEPPRDWKAAYTVVTIGGSSTLCYYLDDRKTWPSLLQEKLRGKYPKVWVGNGGLDGQTTRGHLVFMKEVVQKIKPKVAIFLVGANDLTFSISEDRKIYGNPYDQPYWKFQLFRSRLVQILFLWKAILFDKVTVVKDQGHGNFEPKPLSPDAVTFQDPKAMLPVLGEYRSNLKKIIQLGTSSGTRMIFLTQPMLFEDNAYWRTVAANFYWVQKTRGYLSAADDWRLLNLYNQELLEVCKEENVECFDLASRIPHDPRYFYDSVHLTEKGAELVAEKISGFLKKQG